MLIKTISLQNFRNYPEKTFEFDGQTTLIVGANTVGKTNLLEAIYLLASGKSLRAEVEVEMIGYGEEVARVDAEVGQQKSDIESQEVADSSRKDHRAAFGNVSDETTQLEIILTTGSVGGKNVARKKYLVNGVSRRMINFVGQFKAVYFGPEDLQLITDSPSLRRRYLDMVLFQTDREYRRVVLSYEKGVRQRNKILEEIREREWQPHQDSGFRQEIKRRLYFWDQLLIKNGNYITGKREEFVEFVNAHQKESTRLIPNPKGWRFELEYVRSVISPAILEENFEKEIRAGMTLYGPHRDDIKFVIRNSKFEINKSRDLSIYGSRGEQRLAILWLKMGELEFIHHRTKTRPILLLDDIFSELDEEHREMVLGILGHQQTIITTTEEKVINKEEKQKMQMIRLM